MAVRVWVKIREPKSGKSVSTVAIANAGFETDSLELVLPLTLSKEFGFSIEGAKEEEYMTVAGLATMYKIPDPLRVQVITEDRESDPVECTVSVSQIEREVILSDRLISELKIALEDVGEGLWRFRDEGVTKLRKSKGPQRW